MLSYCIAMLFNNTIVKINYQQIHVAQRITRSATNREIAGSNPVMDTFSFVDSDIIFICFIPEAELLQEGNFFLTSIPSLGNFVKKTWKLNYLSPQYYVNT